MWRQSCRLSYGSVMIPLCSVTLEWLIHSKQACWKGSATWIEHTVWVIQHVLIETSGNFSQFYVQCMWTRGSVVPPPRSGGVHGFRSGSRFCGRRFRHSTQHSTSWHSSNLEVLKRKKRKRESNRQKKTKKKTWGETSRRKFIFIQGWLEKVASIFYFIIVIKKML